MTKCQRNRRNERGVTLVEVAMALVVGAIVVAGALTAFDFVKRQAIRGNQDNNVKVFKAQIEHVKASLPKGAPENYPITNDQLNKLLEKSPRLKKDLYRGVDRVLFTGANGGNSVYATVGPASPAGPITSVQDVIGTLGLASDLIYIYGVAAATEFTIQTTDGNTEKHRGFVILESDSNGKIAAVDGGEAPDE